MANGKPKVDMKVAGEALKAMRNVLPIVRHFMEVHQALEEIWPLGEARDKLEQEIVSLQELLEKTDKLKAAADKELAKYLADVETRKKEADRDFKSHLSNSQTQVEAAAKRRNDLQSEADALVKQKAELEAAYQNRSAELEKAFRADKADKDVLLAARQEEIAKAEDKLKQIQQRMRSMLSTMEAQIGSPA